VSTNLIEHPSVFKKTVPKPRTYNDSLKFIILSINENTRLHDYSSLKFSRY